MSATSGLTKEVLAQDFAPDTEIRQNLATTKRPMIHQRTAPFQTAHAKPIWETVGEQPEVAQLAD